MDENWIRELEQDNKLFAGLRKKGEYHGSENFVFPKDYSCFL
jgi:hypothetical protein